MRKGKREQIDHKIDPASRKKKPVMVEGVDRENAQELKAELELREILTRLDNLAVEGEWLKRNLQEIKRETAMDKKIHRRQGFRAFEV